MDNKNISNANQVYYNRLTNVCYTNGEILEATIQQKKTDSIRDSIFSLFSRMITRCEEQRQVYHFLIYEQNCITVSDLCRKLAAKHDKSERTFRRSIENLAKGEIIKINNGVIRLNVDYDLSLFDLNEVKSLIIHIV